MIYYIPVCVIFAYLCYRQILFTREPVWEFVSKIGGGVGISAYMITRIRHLIQYQTKMSDGYTWIFTFNTLNQLLIQMTFFFFVISYLRRSPAKESARGVKEIVLPLFCAGLPLLIWEVPDIGYYISKYVPMIKGNALIACLLEYSSPNLLLSSEVIYYTMPFLIIGHAITLSGIVWLNTSFSIMSEARKPIFSGPYAYIRHPLYLGESIAVAGVFVQRFNYINIGFTILFIVLQRYRAYIEEKKMMGVYPEYIEYKKRTGAYVPMRWVN